MKSLLDLHRDLLRVRRAEELLAKLYQEKPQAMRTPMHLSTGQEAISVGVCAALNLPADVIFSHHRSHAAYLACGAQFYNLAAELYGKESGCSRGRGGSVHLTAREHGLIATSAILGQTIAAATGSALAFKIRKESHIAVAFAGDAVFEEGILYESLNYAALNKLPVLYVIENNGYSTESPLAKRFPPNTNLCDRAYSFGVAVKTIDGNDVNEVYTTALSAIEIVRGGQPTLIEAQTYRWMEHVGPKTDVEQGRTYRTEAELLEWQAKCPIKRNAEAILKANLASAAELSTMDAEIIAELEADARRASEAEPAHGLMERVY